MQEWGGGSEVGGGRSAEWGEEARLADAGRQSGVRKRGWRMQSGKRGGLEVHLRGCLCGLVFYIIKYSVFDVGKNLTKFFFMIYSMLRKFII